MEAAKYTRWMRVKSEEIVASTPWAHNLAARLWARHRRFRKAYIRQAWGSTESGSGVGSELASTGELREYLPELLRRLNVKTLLDAPCGDWNWMSKIDLSGIVYTGTDIVTEVIERNRECYERPGVHFMVADLTQDNLPQVELILCRDCWVHLSFADISATLENFKRTHAKWLLISNTPSQKVNLNKLSGAAWRHLNLQMPPFNFPPPIEARKDHLPSVPFYITLWSLAEIPAVSMSG